MHKSNLLLAFVGLLATSSLAAEPIVNIIDVDVLALDKRQQNSQSTDNTPPASSTPPRTSSTPPAPTTSAEPTTRSTNNPNTPTPRPTSSTPPPPETSDREPTTSPERPTTTSTQQSSRSTISSIPIVTSRTNIRTTVVTITRDGSAIASEVVSSTVEQETIGSQPTTIPIPNDNASGSSSGLSDSSKKIIAGVVGGVGGAILLGGLALVAWRMWGRKKPETDDYDDIRSGGGSDSLRAEKRQSATPFQSTLDQYHTPAPKPNAAANF